MSFLLSKYFFKEIFDKWQYFNEKKNQLNDLIQKNKNDLYFYLIFLRLFPGSPNWLMNITFPHIGISNKMLIFTVFIGIAPWNFFSCSAGEFLSTLATTSDIMKKEQYIQVS